MRLCVRVPVCDSYPNYVLGSTAHARITNSCSGADLSIFPFSQRVLIRQLYKTRKVTTKTHAKRRDKHDKRWNKISTALGHGQIKLSKTKRTTKPPVPGEKQNEDVVDGARRRLRCVFNVFFCTRTNHTYNSASCPWVLFIYVCYAVLLPDIRIQTHTHTHSRPKHTQRRPPPLRLKTHSFFKASMHMHLSVYIHICVDLYLLFFYICKKFAGIGLMPWLDVLTLKLLIRHSLLWRKLTLSGY